MARHTEDFMAMKGDGYYSKATIGAKHVMDNAAGLVLDAVDAMEPGSGQGVFRVTDMGAADGGTSVDLWRKVLSHVRKAASPTGRCGNERPLRFFKIEGP